MITKADIVEMASGLERGEEVYIVWQRDIKSNLITEMLKEKLPEKTFKVNETINGYTIKSI